MRFGFYKVPGLGFFTRCGSRTNGISQVSRTVATGIFTFGLVLIGFGFAIYLLPRVFATLAAIIFFILGIGCLITAVKVFLIQRQLNKLHSGNSGAYRKNVRIHEEDFDAESDDIVSEE